MQGRVRLTESVCVCLRLHACLCVQARLLSHPPCSPFCVTHPAAPFASPTLQPHARPCLLLLLEALELLGLAFNCLGQGSVRSQNMPAPTELLQRRQQPPGACVRTSSSTACVFT